MSERREQNRARFPFVTACVDALAAEGFTPRVIFAVEGENRIGKEPE